MGIFKSFDRLNVEPINENKSTGLFISKENKFGILVNTIKNINSKSDDEIKYFIYQEHLNILNYDLFMLHQDTRKVAQELFKNVRFLKLFLSVIGFVNLNRHEIICLNKLAYDYYLLDDENKNDEVRDLLLTISYEINKKQVIQLSAILGINRARLVALIGNSSFKEEKSIKRVCNYLTKGINLDEIELTLQFVVDIILIFVNVHFTNIFISIMTDNTIVENENERKIYNLISDAIINILESMTSEDIFKVLYDYYNYLKLVNTPNRRFRMKDVQCSARIKSIIGQIEIGNNPDIW